jgi:hypothetical protein
MSEAIPGNPAVPDGQIQFLNTSWPHNQSVLDQIIEKATGFMRSVPSPPAEGASPTKGEEKQGFPSCTTLTNCPPRLLLMDLLRLILGKGVEFKAPSIQISSIFRSPNNIKWLVLA